MLIHREGWLYSGKTPAFFSGQSGCYCCGVGVGSHVCFYGQNLTLGYRRDVDSYVVDSWTSKTDGPSPGRISPQAATIQGIAYIYGGRANVSPTYLTDNESYVLSTDTFTSKTAMTSSRYAGSGLSISDKAYAAYGLDNSAATTKTMYEYDPSGNSWSTKTDGPTPTRSEMGQFVIGSNGYVAGGFDGAFNRIADNEQYTPSTDTWTSKTDCGSSRTSPGSFTIDGYGWLVMGFSTGSIMLATTEKYDPTGNSWSSGASIGASRDKRYRSGSCSPGSTGSGFVSAGLTALATQSRHHDQLDGSVWNTRTDIPTPARDQLVAAESV